MEREFLAWLRSRIPNSQDLPLGFEDDAALMRMAGREVVLTTDMLTDGVDFLLSKDSPCRIGRKALAVNLSDLAAMAAKPRTALISLALPREGALQLAKEIYEGLIPLADQFKLTLAGGDTNTWDGSLVISVTMIGEPTKRGVLTRKGARPGDRILVTGQFGGSRLGKQFDFQPRVQEALLLHEQYEIHAGMDVSDGLALDLSRLCFASGVGGSVALDQVPISNDAAEWGRQSGDSLTPLEHALGDGEDFELLLAVPAEEAKRLLREQPLEVLLTDIGEFIDSPGLWCVNEQEKIIPLMSSGYEH